MKNIYDYQGNLISDNRLKDFIDNIDVDYAFDSESNANYTVVRIYKKKLDGSYQFPFVYAPNGANGGTVSTLDMMVRDGFAFGINAGVFNVNNKKPDGIVIQNGASIQNTPATIHSGALPLTIDSSGTLGFASADASTSTLIANGIVSAVCGFTPIIVDYEPYGGADTDERENAQRQIIGQFGNGDYAVITCEGRNYDHSDGWTLAEAVVICKKIGLKFAYNLDGGGSTETVLSSKQINTIYENTTGRIVPTFIVFNGKSTFEIPNA
jgi:exopolysaccharide biosynthesis protein